MIPYSKRPLSSKLLYW